MAYPVCLKMLRWHQEKRAPTCAFEDAALASRKTSADLCV